VRWTGQIQSPARGLQGDQADWSSWMGISGIYIFLKQVWVINLHLHTSEQVILHILMPVQYISVSSE
jgi:hypothetical protein